MSLTKRLGKKRGFAKVSFYTRTLADLYVRQGHYSKAVNVFRHLLKKKPGDRDLMAALDAVKAKCIQSDASKSRQPVDLFCRWFDMLNDINRLSKLRRIKQNCRAAVIDAGAGAQTGRLQNEP